MVISRLRVFLPIAVITILVCSATGCISVEENTTHAVKKSEKRGHITATIYERGTIPSSQGSVENNKITKWINETGPVDIKFVPVPRSQSEQKLNTLFAAGEAPDLIQEYTAPLKYTLMDQKLLLPIHDMIEKYSTNYKELLKKYPVLGKVGRAANGELFQFGRINETIPQRGLFIRTDWLKKLNLDTPKTTEELYQVAKAFTERDPDGNGKNDTYGIAMSLNPGAVLDEIFGVTYPDYVVHNNELVHGWDHLEAVTAFKKKIYTEGLVDKNYLNDKNGSKAKQDFLNGKIGIYMDQFNVPVTFYTDFYLPLKRNVPLAELTVIPYPKTPIGQFNPIFVNPIQMTAVVNAQAKDLESVMKYVDFATSETFMKTMYYGFEGIHSKTESGKCPQMLDLDKWKTEFNYGSGDFAILASPILSGKCYYGTEKLSSQDPLQRQVKQMFELNSSYVDFNLQVAGPTHSEQMPQLPTELQQILTEASRHVGSGEGDIWIKSILNPGYSPEMARQDAEAVWEKAGGKKVDDWYRSFYANDRDKIILTKDIYDIFSQQRAEQQK
ncbi:extracellular solute-binding protein [Paenibacillus radicis (ex Xue et al. 2023)]|uniref:Extracellular solute-binding protein n=1 Tax=Paenibacillus radicis (ex Xue et al. 2023) TaxID=2972489 RepID=A0ABT1YA93_9BACL|nr:extracellular solute-binding protein [Paenibacillus radicis (ex Xue et al. 2023)]MCR8630097.1 extracellular solute-binding protein [Paenibacillus radicis (ex Xue et al. 2023)]